MQSDKCIRILYFIENLRCGGKERQFVELIKGLTRYRNIKFKVIIMSGEIYYSDIFKYNYYINYLIRKVKKDPFIFFKILKIVKYFRPDIIHSWGSMPSVYVLPSVIYYKVKFINSMIRDAPNKLPFKSFIRSKFTFPFSNIILANSKAGLKSYHVKSNKGIYIYNGYNFNRIMKLKNKDELRKTLNINTKYIIGMVASFSYKKDYKTFILSAQLILRENYDVTFLCIGSGNYCYYRKLVETQYLDRIKFLNTQIDIESIMNLCDIGVLSTFTEGLPNSIMEFMALGKPVIATDGGGTKELIIDGVTGFLVEQKNPIILANKIKYLLENEKFSADMGIRGRERIIKEFSMTKMTESFISLYGRLLKL
jgi:glycosyltransferase involved in cell wall biosynthesis